MKLARSIAAQLQAPAFVEKGQNSSQPNEHKSSSKTLLRRAVLPSDSSIMSTPISCKTWASAKCPIRALAMTGIVTAAMISFTIWREERKWVA